MNRTAAALALLLGVTLTGCAASDPAGAPAAMSASALTDEYRCDDVGRDLAARQLPVRPVERVRSSTVDKRAEVREFPTSLGTEAAPQLHVAARPS